MARCGYLTLFLLFAILFLVLNEQHVVDAKKNNAIKTLTNANKNDKNSAPKKGMNHKRKMKANEKKKALELQKALDIKRKQSIQKTIQVVGNLVETAAAFIPGASAILEIGKQIWDAFSLITGIGSDAGEITESEKLDQVNNELKDIKSNQYKTHDMLDTLKVVLPTENNKDATLVSISKLTQSIVFNYRNFARQKATNASLQRLVGMCKKATSLSDSDGIEKILFNLHNVANGVNIGVQSIRDMLVDSQQVKEMMCKNQYSPMHILFDLYSKICISELKGLILTQGCFEVLEKQKNYTLKMDFVNYKKDFTERLQITTKNFRIAMRQATLDFWKCTPKKASEYGKLSPIFTWHITPEEDTGLVQDKAGKKFINFYSLYEYCDYYYDPKKTVIDACRTKYCQEGYRCNGYLRGCYEHKEGLDMTVCLANQNSGKKYTQVQIKYEIFGQDDECDIQKDVGNTCLCVCDDHFNDDADRYFNLREVTSDVANNKVIVGARIMKKDRMLQFEIKEGTLLANGNINQTSFKWKSNSFNVFNYGIKKGVDYHKITWDERRVNLDELLAPSRTALTGLKFSEDNDAIKLEIMYTPFDFDTGELNVEESAWTSIKDDISIRNKLDYNRKVPPSSVHTPSKTRNAYFEFNHSTLESDIGQTVVPYIDFQKLELSPATLLSGAALIYKESPHSTGYFSMKLYSYDYTEHLKL